MKRKLTPKVLIIKKKKLECGHTDNWLNLSGECTKCLRPKPVVVAFKRPEKRYPAPNNELPQNMVKLRFKDKPNVISLAFSALINGIKVDSAGYYFLKVNGKWQPANLTMIMKAANAVLAKRGEPQITTNPNWKV